MAELVGGAILNAFLNVLFDRMATPEFMELLLKKKMNRKMLLKLKTNLTTVNAVLYDAEYRQVALKDASVKYFLEDLRDVAFEADDLMDLIAYQVTKAEIQADQPATAGNLAWNFSSLCKLVRKKICRINHSGQVSIPSSVTKKIEEIIEMLEILVKQIDPLGLKMDHRKFALPQRELTTPVVEDSVLGRDSEVVALLNSLEAADENGIGVIPITGMGGIGKTTLAGLVYDHIKAKELFATRAWVCVSDNYDGLRIKKELLQQFLSSQQTDEMLTKSLGEISPQETDVNSKKSLEDLSPQQIEDELKKSLVGKKYLIVLDDVWDNQYDNWNKLQVTLNSGADGSKILVTTRNKDIASMMGTVGEFSTSELTADSCWKIFSKHAFNSREDHEEKQSLREKVVGKCGGLPLVAKMLGGVMRGKQLAEWDAILKSEMWEINCGVIPALMLSYQYLPSHLKQCFAYCATFPQDHKITKEELIQVWMAECFVVTSVTGGDNLVELGEKYVKELVSRCFLQEHVDGNKGSYFLMHDLINGLAQCISGEFLVNMDARESCKFSTRNRYLSFKISNKNSSNMVDSLCKTQFLRTFWSFGGEYVNYKEAKKIVDKLINDLVCLRVVNLHNFELMKLPKSINHLKHLRYLNLTGAWVRRLPQTVCSLYNLQTLILYRCYRLVELPKNIAKLIHLHFLDIRRTTRLRKMSPSIGNLKDLRTLSKFIIGKQDGFRIDELEKLQQLRGELHIINLQNVVDIPEEFLKNKKHLEDLTLEWDSWWNSKRVVDSEFEEKVLERLQPCESIKKISIIGYGGKNLSNWVGDSSYTNIVSLKLRECKFCTKISMPKSLCSLKTLVIEDMKQLEECCFVEKNEGGSLAKLEELTIKNCPKLNVISSSDMIFYCLKKLKIEKCGNLESFPGVGLCGSLESLVISNDKLIGGWCREVGLETFNYLTYLHLEDYSSGNLDCFTFPPNLTSLEITLFKEVKLMKCKDLQQLTQLKINTCENLEGLVEEGGVESESYPLPLLTNLHALEIRSCDKLIGSRIKWGLERFNTLSHLYVGFYEGDDLNCFPEESLLPSSLTSLTITRFDNLEEINYKGIQHLTSLSRLEIWSCSKLRCLPEQGLPSSLSFLTIWNCPLLKARCERGKGQDWPKISHISNIDIR